MDQVIATLIELMRQAHQQLRTGVEGLEMEALNWVPGPDTSSIAILVAHSLGSEGEVLRAVRGLPVERVRATEFEVQAASPAELLARIDAADRLLDELGAALTPSDLTESRPRPGRPHRPGLYWLLRSYGHTREHAAHLDLTRQLYQQRHGR